MGTSFYMVYLEGEKTPTYKHENLPSATLEAQRLARTHRKKAYILCAIKSIVINEFETEDLIPVKYDDKDLPF